MLGGGTKEGFLGDVILQLVSAPLLLVALQRLRSMPGRAPRPETASFGFGDPSSLELMPAATFPRGILFFTGLLVLVPLIQLIPLPSSVWTRLPGRDVLVETFNLLGQSIPWWPISMAPEATWIAVLSLIPPLAIFFSVVAFTRTERRQFCFVLIGFGVVSVFLGLLQLAHGPQSSLRFFQITNPTEAVGFFANRNHYSALLYVATLFGAAWAIDVLVRVSALPKRSLLKSQTILTLAAALTVFSLLVIAQTMARSRAGLLLSIVALFGILALALRHAQDVRGSDHSSEPGALSSSIKAILITTTVAVVFSLQFALYRILDRFTVDPLEDARVLFARKTYALAKLYAPLGTGVGTFVPVYQLHEKPADIAHFFANRAHNDILEAALESGLMGLSLMLVFALWLLRKLFVSWRKPQTEEQPGHAAQVHAVQVLGGSALDRTFVRAATLGLLLLATHSFVDYPLRTTALMVVTALCCGLLIPAYAFDPNESKSQPGRHRKHSKAPAPAAAAEIPDRPVSKPSHRPPPRPRQAWVADKELPESWRSAAPPNNAGSAPSDTDVNPDPNHPMRGPFRKPGDS